MKEKIMIKEALKRAFFSLQKVGLKHARFEAELLLAYLLEKERLDLLARDDEVLDKETLDRYEELILRRSRFEPVAYITGEKHFYGRSFKVTPAVLIPRPETELIIDLSIKYLQETRAATKNPLLLDLGTGSGNVSVTLALEVPRARLVAIDISEEALKVAAENAKINNATEKICFKQGSYYEALKDSPALMFDLIVSNPPYINEEDVTSLPKDVAGFEPHLALVGGPDGLDAYRAICAGLKDYLKPQGCLLLEIGTGQQEAVEDLCLATGLFARVKCHRDLAGRPRVIEARRISLSQG